MFTVPPTKTVTRDEYERWEANGDAWSIPFGPSPVPMVYTWRDTYPDWDGQYWAWWTNGYKRDAVYGPLNVTDVVTFDERDGVLNMSIRDATVLEDGVIEFASDEAEQNFLGFIDSLLTDRS